MPVHSQPQHWPWGAGCIFCCENCLVHCRLLVASWPLPTPCHSTHTSPSSAVITTCVSRHGQCPLGSKIHPLDWEPLLQTYTKNFFLIRVFFFYIKKTILNLNLNWISPYICSKSTKKTYCVSTEKKMWNHSIWDNSGTCHLMPSLRFLFFFSEVEAG